MPGCCVRGCGSYWRPSQIINGKQIKYHTFPKDPERAVEWLNCINQNYDVNKIKKIRICSQHFSDKCYKRDLQNELLGIPSRRSLNHDAVPDLNLPTGNSFNLTSRNTMEVFSNNETNFINPLSLQHKRVVKEPDNIVYDNDNPLKQWTDLSINYDNNKFKELNITGKQDIIHESGINLNEDQDVTSFYKGVMPQCKDRLRYRWLGFHLDLTTSARLRSAATPTRRSRPKKRRQRKKNDPKFETFNLLLALGLVPTKSRMNDPQGLLLNRMHVMDGDCPKSEVIGEKAPELDITSNSNNNKSAITTTTAALTTSTTAIITKDVITNNIRSLSPATDHITLHEQSKNNNNVIITENNKNIEVVSKENSNECKEEKRMNGVNEENEHDLSNIEKCNNSEVIDSEFGDKINDSNKNAGGDKSNNSNDNNVLVNGNNSCSSNNNMSDSSDHCDSDTKSAEIDEEMLAEDEDDVAKEGLEPDDEEMHIDDEDIDKNIIEDEEEVEDNEQHNEENGEDVTKVAVNKVSNNEQINNDGNSIKDNEIISLKKESDEENVQEKNVNISMDVVQETTSTNLPIEATLSALPNTNPPITVRNDTPSTSKIKDERNGLSNEDEEEEDRNSVSSSHVNNSNQNRKRTLVQRNEGEGENENEVEGEEGEGSSSESEGGTKRQRVEVEAEDERERLVREYVERCTQSVEEMSRNADKLQREIGALGELARAKELEWNSILRLRKLKEEMLERLLRRRRQAMMLADNGLTQEWATDYSKPKMNKTHNNQLMMVPVVSSSPGNLNPAIPTGVNSRPLLSSPDTSSRLSRMQRPILPKPILNHHLSQPIPNSSSSLIDPQNTVIGEGRQGPILDVKSIIADYRSRHPENVPRRGRRMKSPMVSSTRISGSPALMSMANMALCSGAHIRNTSQECSAQENSRPSSTDSTRSTHQTDLPAPGLSFKDVLVQFAKMSQPPPPTPNPIKQPPPPPPPYPEVTLHPVPAPQSPPPTHSSLLHGILTKTTATPTSTSTANHRPTTFSPTLARLLTAPERERTTPMMSSQFRPPTSRVSISDLLTSSKKTRNEITITPVSAQLSSIKSKDEVVLLDDDEETDSTDRLVIDESADRERENNGGSEVNSEDIPECQGCHQRAALFVCAGCGNQWYCSRECQVTAWEEHSEVCSDQC